MNNDTSNVRNEIQDLFREVFGDDSIELSDNLTADDVAGWDSIAHINLLIAIERHFRIKFATAEMSGMKADGQNVGTFCRLIESKVRTKK
jgi:acyl carrier protein